MSAHGRHRRTRARRRLVAVTAGLVLVAGGVLWARRDTTPLPGPGAATIAARLTQHQSAPRDRQPYAGLGTWVDGFDFGPEYQPSHGMPAVTPRAIDDMAASGVTTLFLQAVRDDGRSPDGIVDRSLVAQLLIRAHQHGLRVVGWYLPKFVNVDADLAHLRQI